MDFFNVVVIDFIHVDFSIVLEQWKMVNFKDTIIIFYYLGNRSLELSFILKKDLNVKRSYLIWSGWTLLLYDRNKCGF